MLNFSIYNQIAEAAYPDTSEMKKIVIAPGRWNPPHRGHNLLVRKLIALGEKLKAEPVIIVVDSGKHNERNPLGGKTRCKYLAEMFPCIDMVIAPNAYEAVVLLKDQGKVPVGGVSGSDRANTYKGMVNRVFQKEMEYVTEVLIRDPESDDTNGVSSTKVRQAVCEGNFPRFKSMVGLKNRATAVELYEDLRKGLNVK